MSEWKNVIIGDHIDLITGYAFKSVNFFKEPGKGLLPIVKIKNVANGDVSLEGAEYHKYEESFSKWLLYKGDVLISMTGNHPHAQTQVVGEVSKFKLDTVALLNQRVGKFVCKKDIHIDFVYYLYKSEDTRNYLASHSSGSANQANISKGDILGLNLLIPPLAEQESIAAILGSLDDKINLLNLQNVTLERMAETLFRQWFVEDAKEEWPQGKLSDEFDFTMGASPPGESYNEDGIGIPMYQGNADFGFRFPTNRVFTTDPKRFAHKYDTLVSVRAPVGEQNMAYEECCIGRGVAAFRYKKDRSYYSYVYYKMKSLMNEIRQFNETGTVFGSISKADFENLEITIPDTETVTAFQEWAKLIDDKVLTNVNQIHTLTSLRDTLLPKLMSGEVRVKTT